MMTEAEFSERVDEVFQALEDALDDAPPGQDTTLSDPALRNG